MTVYHVSSCRMDHTKCLMICNIERLWHLQCIWFLMLFFIFSYFVITIVRILKIYFPVCSSFLILFLHFIILRVLFATLVLGDVVLTFWDHSWAILKGCQLVCIESEPLSCDGVWWWLVQIGDVCIHIPCLFHFVWELYDELILGLLDLE